MVILHIMFIKSAFTMNREEAVLDCQFAHLGKTQILLSSVIVHTPGNKNLL